MVWSMRMAAQYRLPLRRERRNDRRAMRADGERTLSEHASKALLAGYGVPVAREALVADAEAAAHAAAEIGFPVVVKLCGDAVTHKTERSLVRLGIADAAGVRAAARELLALRRPEEGDVALLVAEMVRGRRELIAGVVRDPQFGPCVMLGLGGILAEAIGDVVFAAAPLSATEARRMIGGLRAARGVLEPLRGEPAVDRDVLAAILVGLGRLVVERADMRSVDVNPLIVRDGKPIAVDALAILGPPVPELPPRPAADVLARFRPLFHPRGVIVAGASSHPGKFGFAAFHNLLRCGFRGEVYPVNRDGGEILGRPCLRSVAEVPAGKTDLAFVCTPPAANVEMLRACAGRGVRAAFVASGGYGEAGEEGRARERELVRAADALGMVLAGPNGQGVISTRESLCAQMVAPYPPSGRISVASQSGNILSAFLNYAVQTGVLRAPSVEHAFEWAASFATQPLPRGRRVIVFTTAGGWGVLAADACVAADFELIRLPEDIRARVDTMVPARWSRNNPIDLAGGETRDTVPDVLDLVCAHPDVDAVLFLGLVIQANQAHLFRCGPFFPVHGLERIAEFHERQDRRYAEAAREVSERHRKPVLVATELVYADRAYGNAGPLAVREGGRVCYPSAHRPVAALRAMVDYAVFRGSVG